MTTINNLRKHDSREFKVGDLVVNKYPEYLPTINSVSYIHGEKLRLKGHDFNHFYVANNFRLATTEEIKAGHRIDLKQCQHGYDIACLICGFGTENGVRVWRNQIESDNVTDIRNHVSPRVVDL